MTRGALASLCLAMAALLALLIGPASALAVAPGIVKVTTSTVTSTTALLQAEINPEGEATTYHFAYGPADCGSNPCTNAPSPDGAVGSKSNPVKVGQELKGLTPGTVYHYRLVATNGSGPSESVDRTFKTYSPPVVSTCPNEVFRGGSAANLPDCRAYEMVSPVDKNGGDIITICSNECYRTALNQVSLDGEKITYSSYKSFGDAVGSFYSNQYLATRGPDGWTTHGLGPRHQNHIFGANFATHWDLDRQFKAFTPDLSTAWFTDDAKPALTPEAVEGEINLYSRDNETNEYHALTTSPPSEAGDCCSGGGEGYGMEVQGYSDDGSHVIISAIAAITPDAHGTQRQIYDYSGGELHLVSILPNGTPDTNDAGLGAFYAAPPDDRFGNYQNAISADGSRLFWSSYGAFGTYNNVYMRKNPGEPQSAVSGGECTEPEKACTLDVSTFVPGSNVGYTDASTDGTKVLLGSSSGVYWVDVDAQTSTLIAGSTNELGASDDLSSIYFSSKEVLAPGGVAGERNLYLWDGGTTRFIAVLDIKDFGEGLDVSHVADQQPFNRSSRVSADGSSVAFMSQSKALSEATAGYDNTDAVSGMPDSEVYVYDAEANSGAGKLLCVSCKPSGAAPVGAPRQRPNTVTDRPQPEFWGAAWLPTAETNVYTSRPLSDDGDRLFFNSYDALLPADTNGKQDVYEWEAQGKGTCDKPDGCLSLISTGESPQNSEFVDASPSGDTVVFSTNSSLLPQDPGLIDLYSATVGGGYPQPTRIATCEGETCQSAPTPPNDPTPASSAFDGPGNLKNARKPARKAHKKHAKKKQHKKKQQSRAQHRNSTQRNG